MRTSLPLRCITTRQLSAGDLTPRSAALIYTSILFSSRLDRDLHCQKVICRHGFAFIFIRHRRRPRLRSHFHQKLAGSSSPRFTGLSLDLTNYGNSFSGVRTRERGGEPASQRKSSFWREGERRTPSRMPVMNNALSKLMRGADQMGPPCADVV